MTKPKLNFNMVYMNQSGEFIDSGLPAVFKSGNDYLLSEDLIPLPKGSDLMYLPGRLPLAYNDEEFQVVDSPDDPIYPLAAVIPSGYTRTLLPAYENKPTAPDLPLFSYTAIAIRKGELFVAAEKTDDPTKWNPLNYSREKIEAQIIKVGRLFPKNRLVDHLSHCALDYKCLTAANIFLRRWEGGIPTSISCNAKCLGCISFQESDCPSPQTRIDFTPTPEEIAQLAIFHLKRGQEPIISFGQGCEGEPLLATETIAAALKMIRKETSRGIINMNTNASSKKCLLKLQKAGLDSIRISMISNTESTYNKYHNPINYTLFDVQNAGSELKKAGLFISLNLLTIPGLNDMPGEIKNWENLAREGWIDLVQFRNLSIDPDWLFERIELPEKGVGITQLINTMSQYTKIGNFSSFEI